MLGHCLLCNAIRPLACCHIPALDQSWHVMVMFDMQTLSFRPRSCALCCPVHASNLEGPGTLVPAFYLATSIVLRPSRRLGDTKSRHQPLICASIEGPDRPC